MKEIKVKYEKNGKHFEILVNEKVFDYLEGKIKDIREILIVEEIFKDVNKGERASEEDIKEVFGSESLEEIVNIMITKGYVQIPTEIRRKWVEQKKRQIIDFISRNAIDPKTKLPIPPQRIELAMEQIKYNIDPFKGVEKQAEEIIKKLVLVIPIKFEKVKIAIKIPPEYYGKVFNFVKKEAQILNEEWSNDGNWIALVEVPGGYKVRFIDEISRLTNGEAQVKVLTQ